MPKSQKAFENSVKWCIVSIEEEARARWSEEDSDDGGCRAPADTDFWYDGKTSHLLVTGSAIRPFYSRQDQFWDIKLTLATSN